MEAADQARGDKAGSLGLLCSMQINHYADWSYLCHTNKFKK